MNGENTPGHDLSQGQPLGPAISRPGTKGASPSVGSANMLPPFVPRAPEPPAAEPLPVDDLLLSVPAQDAADPADAGDEPALGPEATPEEIEIQQPGASWLSHVERAEELFVSDDPPGGAGGPGAGELPWLMVEDDTKMPAEEEGAGAPYLRLMDEEGGDSAGAEARGSGGSVEGDGTAESTPDWMSWDESEEPEAPADVGLIETEPRLTPWEQRPVDGLLPEEDVAFMAPTWGDDPQPESGSEGDDAGVTPIDSAGPDEREDGAEGADDLSGAGAWTGDAWTDAGPGGDAAGMGAQEPADGTADHPPLELVDDEDADEDDSPWTDSRVLGGPAAIDAPAAGGTSWGAEAAAPDSADESAWDMPLVGPADAVGSPADPGAEAGDSDFSAAFYGDPPREAAAGDEPLDERSMVASSLDDELSFPSGAEEEPGVDAGTLDPTDLGTEGASLSFANAVTGETADADPFRSAEYGAGGADTFADHDVDMARAEGDVDPAREESAADAYSFAPSAADAGGADHADDPAADDLYAPEAAAMEPVEDLMGGGGGAAAAPEEGGGSATGAAVDAAPSSAGADAPASPLHEVAARLEEIAASLRKRTPAELLSGASDPLEIMIAGYVLGYTRGATGPGSRAGE